MAWTKTRYPGVYVQHRKACPAPASRCRCTPSYRVRFRPRDSDGNVLAPQWSPVMHDLSEARNWQSDTRRTDPEVVKRDGGTFEALGVRWVEGARSGAITHKGRKYAPRTVTMYARHLKRWVYPEYGGRDAAALTARDWQLFVDDLARKGLSHNTLQSVFNAPRAIYRWACAPSRSLLPGNATVGVEFPARDEKPRDRIAPPEEAARLLGALDEQDRPDYALALYAGLRGKERRGLDWDRHVVFKGGKPVALQITRDITKSDAGVRKLPVIALLRPVLMREWLRQGKPTEGPVVPRTGVRSDSWEAHYEAQRKRAKKAFEDAGLEPIQPHEARHTFASYLIAAQAKAGRPNAKVIQTLMGHTSIQVTFDRYGHLMPGHEDEAGELLDAYLGMGEETGMNQTTPITVYGNVDPRAIEQLERCAQAGDAIAGALCADGHVGYSQPIGGAVAYADYISPSGVGYDIACGNKAVRTNVRTEDIDAIVPMLMDEIFERISFGVGRKNSEPVDHPVLDAIREADFAPQRQLRDMAAQQLGTVGSGNHYVDLFAGDDGYVWIGVHFGSRGFGHKTASGFLALAEGKRFEEHATEGEMDSPPILFHVDSDLGQAYIAAMTLAGEYAYAGRDTVVAKVLEILGAEATYEVHNHHNFAWRERHFDSDVWVIRKGCTPAFPGQAGFVGATMGEPSVILRGVESDEGAGLLYSTVHGAGRVMSRTRAAGKSRKRWACLNRDCDWWQGQGQHKPENGKCPDCGSNLGKRMIQMVAGEIDWDATRTDLATAGIELRGAGADEAPGAYKRLDVVLAAHAGTVEVLHRLTPIGVAMAGADTFDPYKD